MGNMAHSEADALLKQQPNANGSYLVHDHGQNIRCLALRGRDRIVHYQIHSCGSALYIVEQAPFQTLQDLISHSCQGEGLLFTTLKEPCSSHFGPLQPLALPDVSEKQLISEGSFGVMKELEVDGKRCVGVQLHDSLLSLNAAEQHEMLLQLTDNCQKLKRAQHPNIEQFIGFHILQDSQLPYLVMELLDSTLSGYLEKHGVPDAPTYYNILSDVALGLRYLHQQSPPIIHRDLSANNVLLSSSLQAKVKAIHILHGPAQSDMKVPTMSAYLPPEAQVEKPQYTTATDSFSFGVLMIHTLCEEGPAPNLAENSSPYENLTQPDQCTSDEAKKGESPYANIPQTKPNQHTHDPAWDNSPYQNVPVTKPKPKPKPKPKLSQPTPAQTNSPHENLMLARPNQPATDNNVISPSYKNTSPNQYDTYIERIGRDHPLAGLIRKCLHHDPDGRPNMSAIVAEITDIQVCTLCL